MITDKFTSGSFTAPTVSTNNEGVEELGEISLLLSEDGEYVISFEKLTKVVDYEYLLINNVGDNVADNYYHKNANVLVTLEDLIIDPSLTSGNYTLKVKALENENNLLAESSLSISLIINTSEATEIFNASLEENGALNISSNAFKDLEDGASVYILTNYVNEDNQGEEISMRIPAKFFKEGIFSDPEWIDAGSVHEDWKAKAMILKKTIFENDTYTINIIQFNDWRDQAVTMPEMVE